MHILHVARGAAAGLALQADLLRINRCDDVDDLDLWMHQADPDAVILDPVADGGAGRRWAHRYRSRAGRAGLIFAVGEIATDLAIPLYDIGDDLVRLPVRPDELLARAGAIVRRCRGFESACLRIGKLTLDRATLRTRYAGFDLRLARREFCLVELLMLRAGRAVARETIMHRLYQDRDEAGSKMLDVFVCRIRAKLREAGAPEGVIQAVYGVGYMIEQTPGPATGALPHLQRAA